VCVLFFFFFFFFADPDTGSQVLQNAQPDGGEIRNYAPRGANENCIFPGIMHRIVANEICLFPGITDSTQTTAVLDLSETYGFSGVQLLKLGNSQVFFFWSFSLQPP
jgi:hypothetical protein